MPPKMLWNWYTIDTCFISSTWHVTSRGMFAGSCIGVVLLVMSLELLRRAVKEYDGYLIRKHTAAVVSPRTVTINKDPAVAMPAAGFRPTIGEQAVRALLHTVQFAVAYFVMLYVCR